MLRLAETISSQLQELGAQQTNWFSQPVGGQPALAMQQTVASPHVPLVETAVLELHPQPLHEQILTTAERAIAAGFRQLNLMPLFLLPGVHVMEDIPTEVAVAQRILGDRLALRICPHLGSHPQLKTLLTVPANSPATAAQVLLSHGSRRPGGNQPVEAVAVELGATVAYWSVEPKLEAQVAHLVQTGCRDIVILPYFLFAGGITDAIGQLVQQISCQYPYVRLHLADPIGDSNQLAKLVIDLT
jgi:sirohydrochlorin cobaltochelatase